MTSVVYKGGCICGQIAFEYEYSESTKPFFNAFCHCRMCRDHASAPFNHIIGVPKDSFKFTKGVDEVKEYNMTEKVYKLFCPTCGTLLLQGPKHASFVGTLSSTYEFGSGRFPTLPDCLKPTMHCNYENAILPEACMKDGLPKFKIFAKETGGSGELVE